jgi:ABC-type multidrug transport system fused ATPase/permease subunit
VSIKKEKELKNKGALTVQETKKSGLTEFGVYIQYVKHFNSALFTIMLFLFIVSAGIRMFSDFWISYWAVNRYPNLPAGTYPRVYLYLVLIMLFILSIRSILISKGAQLAGDKLHLILMNGILSRPLSFFDTTPVGVILNRATGDIGNLDVNMPNMYQHAIITSLHLLSIIIMVALGNPLVLIAIFIILIWYISASRVITKVNVDLKRVSQITVSPLISVLAESLRGSISLKAYQRTEF